MTDQDLARNPARAVVLCREADERLMTSVAGLGDEDLRTPSLLPGWTVGHVLTHLARNADGHARRVEGSLRGESLGKYAGGAEQRSREIEEGVSRPVTEVLADVRASHDRLAELFDRAQEQGWPHGDLHGGEAYPVTACPAHRLREIEMHHVDLGLDYTAVDWPSEYVAWDIGNLLPTVVDRLSSPADRAGFMAWLAGRGRVDPGWTLSPWG